jgi:mitochondrial chaperone BCS1
MMANTLFEFAKGLPPWAILGFGVVTGSLRSAWSFIYEHTIGYVMVRVSLSLTVEDVEHREAYLWLSHWVERNLHHRRINSLLLRKPADDEDNTAKAGPQFRLIPEYGTYYMTYRKRLMMVEHSKESQPNMTRMRPTHMMRLRIWLAWDRNTLFDILREAKTAYEESQPTVVEYFRMDPYGDWDEDNIPPRDLQSVYHPEELIRDLLGDIQTYLDSKKIYTALGIPYRRGYLLTGPPGTGKSTLILAMASHFKLPIYSVPLRGTELTGERLLQLLSNCRKPSLIALEDVDCLQVATRRTSKSSEGLTMADLLNVIDGIGASEDRVLFMTANHPERLDAALTRAGRVDRKFYIDYARDEELRRFYNRLAQYYPMQPWSEFRAALPGRATIADAQALAFQRRNSERVSG